jgi:type IV pilus biogenesis protein PilP
MQNKKLFLLGMFFCGAVMINSVFAQENAIEEMEQVSADAIAGYQVEGSLFQQITDLEQEKVLMQLEKERAQLDLELDRLAAEKIKLHMEIDTLSGRAEQQQQEIETQKAKLEAEAVRIEREKEALLAEKSAPVAAVKSVAKAPVAATSENISKNYKLVNVVGAGAQLQATIADLNSGQTKRISVGKKLDDWTVKSISLDDGVVFVGPDGEVQNLNVSNGK